MHAKKNVPGFDPERIKNFYDKNSRAGVKVKTTNFIRGTNILESEVGTQ